MTMSRLGALVLFIGLSACNFKGCGSGQTLTLIYRGSTVIDVETQIMKDGASIGFVEKIREDQHGQRILMRVRDTELIHEGDAFLAYDVEGNKKGLRVLHVGGRARSAGSTFYYPPLPDPALSVPDAQKKPDSRPNAMAETFAGDDEEAAREAKSDIPLVTFEEDTYARRDMRRTLAHVMEANGIPPHLKKRFKALQQIAREPGNEAEILMQARRELPKLRQEMAASAREAYLRGDREAAKEQLDAVQKTRLFEDRLRDQSSRNIRTTPKDQELDIIHR